MSEQYKEVTVKGPALIPAKTRKAQRKNQRQNGGDPTHLERIVPQVSQALTNFGPTKQSGGNTGAIVNLASTRVQQPAPDAIPLVSGVAPSQPAPVGGGVTLAPKRKSRISLKPKKGLPTPGSKPVTHKARKINFGSKGVTARLMRAKKVKKDSMALPLEQVKSALEKAKVIKKTSKAPEHMLRNMYADLLITKKGL